MDLLRNTGILLAAIVAACTSVDQSPDFIRHRESQLVVPYDRPDILYFDVKLSASLPDDDAAAEAQRMAWLQGWLDVRKLCPNGYEILDRRPFRFEEMNPGRYDLRYEVSCKAEPPAAKTG